MPKKFLILKTGTTIAPLLAQEQDFENWFIAGSGAPVHDYLVCSLYLGQALPDLEQVRGIFITGSAAYVTDQEPWNHVGADFLRLARLRGVPVLAVCYGHQLAAWTFGGTVEFHPRGREIATVRATSRIVLLRWLWKV